MRSSSALLDFLWWLQHQIDLTFILSPQWKIHWNASKQCKYYNVSIQSSSLVSASYKELLEVVAELLFIIVVVVVILSFLFPPNCNATHAIPFSLLSSYFQKKNKGKKIPADTWYTISMWSILNRIIALRHITVTLVGLRIISHPKVFLSNILQTILMASRFLFNLYVFN